MKIIFLLCLIFKSKNISKCNQNITNSYGINGLLTPKNEFMVLCPSIRSTCCPSYE